jgi:hypothetical protein
VRVEVGCLASPAVADVKGCIYLPYNRTCSTLYRMKTTLVLPDPLALRLKAEAARRGTSMSEVVAEALLRMLDVPASQRGSYRLPSFDMGPPLVDVADRDALYDLLDRDPGG